MKHITYTSYKTELVTMYLSMHEGILGGVKVQFHSLLTSAPKTGEWSTPITLGKQTMVTTEQLAV
jgi:hypothetical protein